MSVPPRVGGHKRSRACSHGVSLDGCAVLRRPPRRVGAEEGGAGGDEEGAG